MKKMLVTVLSCMSILAVLAAVPSQVAFADETAADKEYKAELKKCKEAAEPTKRDECVKKAEGKVKEAKEKAEKGKEKGKEHSDTAKKLKTDKAKKPGKK